MDWRERYITVSAEVRQMKGMPQCEDKLYSMLTEWSLKEGHYRFLEKLIGEGLTYHYDGDLNISACLANNDIKTFKILMKYNKAYRADLTPALGRPSALHEAARLGNMKCLKLVIDAGAYIDHYTDGKGTPIRVALNGDSEEIVLLFLENGADLENVFEAFSFQELIEHCASKLWARSIIIFTEKERLQRLDGMMFVKSNRSQTRTSVSAIESIIEDQLELLQYINDAIETIREQDQTGEAVSAIQRLEEYAKELESKCNEVIDDLNNTL